MTERLGSSRSGTLTSMMNSPLSQDLTGPTSGRQTWLLPVLLMLLMLLFAATLVWLPRQAQRMEADERQEQLIADTLWVEQTIRFQLGRHEESLRLVGTEIASGHLSGKRLQDRIINLIRNNRELNRIVWLDASGNSVVSSDDAQLALTDFSVPSRDAFARARAARVGQYSLPSSAPGLSSPTLMDYHFPLFAGERYVGSLVASYGMDRILEQMVPWWFAQDNEIALIDSDDKIIVKRAAGGPGRGVYTHRRMLELPGLVLTLRTDSVKSAPKLLPNLLVGSVIALSIGLLWSVWALWRDTNRRVAAEGALRQEVVFRTAMENSVLTGLRARDMQGRITYVNPAFCRMVGIPAQELIGRLPPMPYWAPESTEVYQERFSQVLAGTVTPQFETVFQRANGERFPVLIFESPLMDHTGRQTGWMGSLLDISDRRQVEDLNRQQQEKLQASARLASMGEIASSLAHELNQPLAAISSYTTGALNMLETSETDGDTAQAGTEANFTASTRISPVAASSGMDLSMLKSALEKAAAQAQRAGHIIRSVHAFVKKHEPTREPVAIQSLLDNVLPLVELQARKSFVAVQCSVAPNLPPVLADAVLLEQVLLNLTRNGIEAMQDSPQAQRVLRITASMDTANATPNIVVSVIDHGHGISAEVAERLFSPFFSTKAEGMGMGLKICRTTIEFHGGTLTHVANPLGGTIFRFSVPVIASQEHTSSAALTG